MRLPVDARGGCLALGLSALVAGCGLAGSGDRPASSTAAIDPTGPAADYPMVLGDPFTVDGVVYTPADTLNYDAVGFAGLDNGEGITAAHRTLPLPSYVEVTSLDSGKTMLVRVEGRGPMTGGDLIALSPAAAAQLDTRAGTPVRVRRVNPIEAERALLRAGEAATPRMETPKPLVEVLRRKLPAAGYASLTPLAPAVPLKPIAAAKPPVAVTAPAQVPSASKPAPVRQPGVTGKYQVQAATFSVRAGAEKVAATLGGTVVPAGKFFRVRTGPFASRGQADAALAKVRSAGYSDARVITSD